MDKVVVTYRMTPGEKALIRKVLGHDAALTFVDECSSVQARSDALRQARVLLAWNFPAEVPPTDYPSLQGVAFIQLGTAGADHLPSANIPEHILVACNPGAYASAMAEHVLSMILALAKRLLTEHQKLRGGQFDDTTFNRSLSGMTAGIIGFGGAGRATAKLMRAFGMRIYAINTSGTSTERVDFLGTLRDLEIVLRESDVVVLTLPLTKATLGVIGKKELSWMKQDALLVNVARGALIDEEALYTHLKDHPTFQVGIDTWWEEPLRGGPFRMKYPFLELPNVLGSPHNSALVPEVIEIAAELAAENVKRFLYGEEVVGVVRREDYL